MTQITLRTVGTVLTAGAFATIAFDAFGQALSPLFGYAKLAPVGLAGSSLKAIFGANPSGAAHLLHALTGLVFYAVGYFAIARPVQLMVAPRLHWSVTAVVYGITLWFFALYVMAHLVTGNKPFLGWTGITWVALWGHIVYALVAAAIMEAKCAVLDLRRDPVAVPAE
ncbi:hypothetical protein [uncultured Tateyamaria sp.]|uniref:hypothetical protein n=1 Tax=uncultured Tateyamaria sp. TaxID=455651 RepID=UPI002611B987|nr:hypothetical protein [uncultured Tateyamaria sp.]